MFSVDITDVVLPPTVDQIYHLASPASPPNYMYNPIKTLKTNTIGTLNMLGESASLILRLLSGCLGPASVTDCSVSV